MSPSRAPLKFAIVALTTLLPTLAGRAQVILHNFAGVPSDGQNPDGALTRYGSAFYGVTSVGGSTSGGTLFSIGADGTGYDVLRSFAVEVTGAYSPVGNLAQSGGIFYGMTQSGGGTPNAGTLYSINPDGSGFAVLHAFSGDATDGSGPLGSPVVSGGVIYGMTMQGGIANQGVVYRMNPDGTGFQVVHSFTGSAADGSGPTFSAPVVAGGVIYGTTPIGGTAGLGAIFKMNTDGTGFTVLHSFTATGDGYDPAGGLTLVGNTLYGMTFQGGTNGTGTIFAINTDGSGYALLHNFVRAPTDGAQPVGTLFYDGVRLFGSTPRGGAFGTGSNNALGVLFDINLDGSDYDVFHSFDGGLAGGGPTDVIEFNGLLYGMTAAGGSAGDGVIYSIPVPEPSSLAMLAAGAAAMALPRRRLRRPVAS